MQVAFYEKEGSYLGLHFLSQKSVTRSACMLKIIFRTNLTQVQSKIFVVAIIDECIFVDALLIFFNLLILDIREELLSRIKRGSKSAKFQDFDVFDYN